jgi:hypothetical protein
MDTTFSDALPPTPPMAQVDGPQYQAQAAAEQAVAVEAVHGPRHSLRRKIGVGIASIAAVVAAAGYIDGNSGSNHVKPPQALSEVDVNSFDACSGGMFPDGPYSSSLNVQTQTDLIREPESTMKTPEDLVKQLFGDNGTLCDSAIGLAVYKQSLISVFGEGAARAKGFDVFTSVDAQRQHYIDNPDDAKTDATRMASITLATARLNSSDISGAYEQVIGVRDGEVVNAEVVPVDKQFATNTVFVLLAGGDSADTPGQPSQRFAIDTDNSQFYLSFNIGINEKTPDQANQSQGQSDNGGGQFGTSNGTGESNRPGNVQERGGDGGVTPGTVPSFGPGTPETPGTPGTPGTTEGTTPPDTTTTTEHHDTTTTSTLPPKGTPSTLPPPPPGGY